MNVSSNWFMECIKQTEKDNDWVAPKIKQKIEKRKQKMGYSKNYQN